MAVIPASHRLDLHRVRELLGATSHLRLATEAELERDFPMFDVGAMPPLAPMMPMPEILDVHLLYHDRSCAPAATTRTSLRMDPRDLMRCPSRGWRRSPRRRRAAGASGICRGSRRWSRSSLRGRLEPPP